MFKSNKKIKLNLYFKSGSVVSIECDAYKFTHERESLDFIGYQIDGMSPHISFVPSQLECYLVGN